MTFTYSVKTTVLLNGKVINEILSNHIDNDWVDCRDNEFWKDNAFDIMFQNIEDDEHCEFGNIDPEHCQYLVSYGAFPVGDYCPNEATFH